MQKEKKVRSYQRRTKSGKMVTVKAHTAKYDAADKDKEMTKKEGAGKELEERKKKAVQLELPFDKESEKKVLEEVKEAEEKPKKKKVRPVGSGTNGPVPKKKTTTKKETTEPAFTAAEFKEWYQGTGSAADKKVAKALRAQLGRTGYRKLEDEAIDNYSSRGHLSMFKRVSGGSSATTSTAVKKRTKGDEIRHNIVLRDTKRRDLVEPERTASAKSSTGTSVKSEKTTKGTRYASGAKLNEDGTFVSEKDYKKSIAHRNRKGARISPEEVKAIKMYEKATKEESTKTAQPRPRKK